MLAYDLISRRLLLFLLSIPLVLTACQVALPQLPVIAVPSSTPAPVEVTTTPAAAVPEITAQFTPAYQPTATLPAVKKSVRYEACWKSAGEVLPYEITDDALPAPMTLRVYLPPCYDQERQQGYPVIYLLHGQTFNDDQWDRLGMDDTADKLISDEGREPFLIVMPAERNYYQDLLESSFDDQLLDILIPWVDSTFNTCSDRSCRALGGLSRGAVWALRIGFMNWETFGSIGLHSLPGGYTNFVTWLREIPVPERPRVYLDTGINDPDINKAARFNEMLNGYSYIHEWHLNKGTHNEAYWSTNVEDYLRFYIEPWQTQADSE